MMFSVPAEEYEINPVLEKAVDRILMLHADHEQNASTSTVRLAGSSGANPFACIAAGIASLWGPSHGGANEAVINMLNEIGGKQNIPGFLSRVKDKQDHTRLMGFGHRVYKNYDPRAKVMRQTCHEVLTSLGITHDPLLELAMEMEQIALKDDYFISKKLYPNVDFYSGIIFRAIGIPTSMFTVLFAVARTVGWISQWNEMIEDPDQKIGRPRQLYNGHALDDYFSYYWQVEAPRTQALYPWRFDRRGLTAGTAGDPRAIAAPGVGRLAAHVLFVEPQRLCALAPGVAAVDHQARAAAAALGVDGRQHDVGIGAGFRQTPVVAHQGNTPRALAPAAKAGAAAEARRLLVGAGEPALGALLAAAPRPGVGDEAVGARRGDMDHAFVIAQAEHAAVVAHQQVGRRRRAEQQADRHDRQSGEPPAMTPQAEPQAADRDQPQAGARQRRHEGRRVRPVADILGDAVQAFDAPAHGHQAEALQPERHQQHRDKPHGMIQKPVSGTPSRLATTPSSDRRLKW